jgi:hypothetical protein
MPSATREPSAALERPRARVLPVCCLHTDGQLFSTGLSVGASVQAGMCIASDRARRESARRSRQGATRKAPAGRAAAGLLITVALSRGLAQRTSPLACWRPPLQGEAYASGVSASDVSPLACRSFSNLPATRPIFSEDSKHSKGFRTIETFLYQPVQKKFQWYETPPFVVCNQWHTIQILTHFWL